MYREIVSIDLDRLAWHASGNFSLVEVSGGSTYMVWRY